MAEEIKNNGTETTETTAVEETTATETKPNVDELMAQIAQLTSDRDKYKSANDKLSKSEAEMKRQLRAKLSAEEQQAEEMAEAQRLRDEEFEAMKAQQNVSNQQPFSVADELKKFKELLDMGIITEDEFNAKKKELLGL